MGLPGGTPALTYLVPDEQNNIPALLVLANQLQKSLPNVFGWCDLFEIILHRDLGLLHRHPIMEQVYIHKFGALVKKEYGGAVGYLRQVLGWPEGGEAPASAGATQRDGGTPAEDRYWTRTDEVVVRKNDWAYSIPHDVEHYVCWTRLPIFHPSLCTPSPDLLTTPPPKNTWEDVQALGLGGATGFPVAAGPAPDVVAFVKARWPEDQWDTLWFANPPHLQSVPGLSHWHVMARRKVSWCCKVDGVGVRCPVGGKVWAER